MNYEVRITRNARRDIEGLSEVVQQRVLSHALALRDNPRPSGCVKLSGSRNEYRLRVGDYRIRYAIDDRSRVVEVLRCGHRGNFYRG